MPFQNVAIVGLGLLGGSVGLAVQRFLPGVRTTGYDASSDVRQRAAERGLTHQTCDSLQDAVSDADLIILCVPVGAMAAVGASIAPYVKDGAVISDVGSSKQTITQSLQDVLPGKSVIPAHPVAGTEYSGPDAGFPTLFQQRWCIITPPDGASEDHVTALGKFWEQLGAIVEIMDAAHHDMVLAVTSHIPHLIAYTIVGTASDLEDVTRSEVIKYSAGGFRDFTRIAASNPTMWRDVFLHNKDAVLEMLDRFLADLAGMQQAIRNDDGDSLFAMFTRTRDIRRSIVALGQDKAGADFGRTEAPSPSSD